MEPAQRLARVSILAAQGREGKLRKELSQALQSRIPLRAIHETLLQLHLLCGFARMINAFLALQGVAPSARSQDGKGRASFTKGERLCRRIYGRHYAPMMNRFRKMHPALPEWVLQIAYARVLTRPGLAPVIRELVTTAVLASQGISRQLYFHTQGALRLGATPLQVRRVLYACSDLMSKSRMRRAISLVQVQ